MREVGVWPEVERGADFATKYAAVNTILNDLAKDLEVDLWTLDALWWRIEPVVDGPEPPVDHPPPVPPTSEPIFGLEQHLHDFLRDNWDQTEFGREWDLLEEDGEVVGYKYNTRDVGEIDLLAKHNTEPKWLVIELKRGRTSDQVVGQVLRYRGWVMENLAQPDEEVGGLIIGHEVDRKLLYALKGVSGVRAKTYTISFSLSEPELET